GSVLMSATSPSLPPRQWKPVENLDTQRRSGGPQWRRERALSAWATVPRWRRWRAGVAALLLMLLLGILVWVISWFWPVRPSALVLVGASYDDNLNFPANVHGWQGLNDLAELCNSPSVSHWWGPGWPRLVNAPTELHVGEAWDRGLDDVAEKTVVVFF